MKTPTSTGYNPPMATKKPPGKSTRKPIIPQYVSPVKIGTVVLRDGIAEMVNSVPLVRGGTLLLISPGDPREIRIQDFLEEIHDGDLEVLWDPELRMIPDENHNYLETHGFLKDNDEVGE